MNMCGIAGFVNLNSEPPQEQVLRNMLIPMICRGPDGEGVRISGPAALGHRRLAVIDLLSGAQPMCNEDGSVWITFNGEIFNYRELRTRLLRKGHRFRTEADTEVLVHLYEEYGTEMFAHLSGFYAFAIYNVSSGKLLLARDCAGVKPLFYFQTPEVFAFASTIPALRRHPAFPHELDRQALWDFLSLQYIPQETAYRKVRRLEPGSFLELNLNGSSAAVRRFWKPETLHENKLQISYRDACAELEKRVRQAVAERLIADVPLGVFLSGGVDSAIVAGLAAEMNGSPLHCYSIAFREKTYDERESAAENAAWARQFARHGLIHRIQEVDPCDISILEKRIAEYGQPFADASLIPTSQLCAFARSEVTVALGGDGADEMFRGYERYMAMRYLEKSDFLPAALRKILTGTICSLLPDHGGERGSLARARRFFRGIGASGAERYLGIVSHTGESLKRRFCGSGFEGMRPTLEQFDTEEHPFGKAGDVPLFDLRTYLPCDILAKADTASMSASLELRSPFLDRRVMEFALSLPENFKEQNGHRKRILTDTFARYLPPGLARRRKRGFGVPLADWFRGEWKNLLLERLPQGEGVKSGMFSKTGIEQLIAEHQAGCDRSYALFSALVLEMFLDSIKP